MHLCVHLLVCQDSFQPKLGLLDAAKSLALAEMVQNKLDSVTIPTQQQQNGNGNGQKRERERPETGTGTARNGHWNGQNGNWNGPFPFRS